VAGVGRLAVAPKFEVQAEAELKSEGVLPQAVIDAGDVALTKFVGEDWKLMVSRSAGVVEEEV
jgi:hypothetical protein